jgi:hypothetical protein
MKIALVGNVVALTLLTTACEVGSGGSEPSPSQSPTPFATASPYGPCATSRLGHVITDGGVTYTCQTPMPYRWLPSARPMPTA